MASKIDNALSFQTRALGLRAYRQEILASNIANADTPNYKARDFDFTSALNEAVAGRSTGALSLATTNARPLPGAGEAAPAPLLYRSTVQPSVDGNTVDMDVERSQFSENAMQYQASLTFITSQIRLLQAAVQA